MHKFLTAALLTTGLVLAAGCPDGSDDTSDSYQEMRVKAPDAGWRIEVVDPTKGETKDLRAE